MWKQLKIWIPGIVLIMALALTAAARDPRITSDITVTPTVKLTADENRAVSHAAARILKHINQARVAIEQSEPKTAQGHVDKALTLVQIVERAMPDYTVEAKIQVDDLVYTDKESVKPLTVPIFDELEKVQVLAPIKVAKEEEAIRAQETLGGQAVPVEVELVNTRADLNVQLAKKGLEKAQTALTDNQVKEADRALVHIQTGVLFRFAEIDLPLETARKNIMLAKTFVEEEQYDEARFAMDVASDALENYEIRAGEHRAAEVKQLREDMNTLAQELDKDQTTSIKKLEGWWDTMIEWFE